MTSRPPRNLAASIHRRLLNGARERGEDAQFILQRYAAERFLYRLGNSSYREQFVLKGAMLFALWGGSVYRPTRDLDFTGYGSDDVEAVRQRFRDICTLAAEDDGISFDTSTLTIEPIRDEAEYSGFRVVFDARLGTARIRMQVDVGFGNAIEPAAQEADYPTLLDAPAPRIRAYPHEAVVAEKLHAMVVLAERNSRLKDFYDLHVLARQFPFDGERLARAITATFQRRRTGIAATIPAALAPRFYADEARAGQWRAYLTRNSLPGAPADFATVGELLQSFLGPLWGALAAGRKFSDAWPPTGPWKPASQKQEPRE
ncbi:MAG: nucleotidyl transferase AbiEii/AbiGii toxin family protein [Deltaproteobacteria bacterium]|nr:nucleotidyl transferase AbiEii/AbiGii toxin family protein [Deltaproteobacteria bacterium]